MLDENQVKRLAKYWSDGANDDFAASKEILDNTKRYAIALFHMHLALEKLLKSKIVEKMHDHPPYTHNLIHLSSKLKLQLNDDQIEFLSELSQFNLTTRYPSEKDAIRSFATQELAKNYMIKTEETFQWILLK